MGKPTLVARGFGRWISELRRGRSYEAIAGRVRALLDPVGMKVHPSLILKIEQGRVPNVALLYALSRVLKVPIDEMVLRLMNDLGLATEPPAHEERASERALALVTWFDELPPSRQDAVFDLLNVPDVAIRRPFPSPRKSTRAPK